MFLLLGKRLCSLMHNSDRLFRVVVSNMFYVHPYLGKIWSILTILKVRVCNVNPSRNRFQPGILDTNLKLIHVWCYLMLFIWYMMIYGKQYVGWFFSCISETRIVRENPVGLSCSFWVLKISTLTFVEYRIYIVTCIKLMVNNNTQYIHPCIGSMGLIYLPAFDCFFLMVN